MNEQQPQGGFVRDAICLSQTKDEQEKRRKLEELFEVAVEVRDDEGASTSNNVRYLCRPRAAGGVVNLHQSSFPTGLFIFNERGHKKNCCEVPP